MNDLAGSDNLRDELIELLESSQHAPMETHDGRSGECLQCPWPLCELGSAAIADELVPLVERRVAAAKTEAFNEAAKIADDEKIYHGEMSVHEEIAYRIRRLRDVALASGQEGK